MKNRFQWFTKISPLLKENSSKLRISYYVIWNLMLLTFIIGLIGFSFVSGVGAGYFASLVDEEPIRSKDELNRKINDIEETSEVYFGSGESLGKLKTDLVRERVTLDQISPHLVDALIATEDEYFNEHEGVVPKAILRALFQEVTNASTRSGGSTLTQQLIKNQVLTNEVSFDRKAKEILLSLRVENFFEKEEILEAYLNVATFGRNSAGQNIAGVQATAKGLFGVEAKDLTLPQAAYIAGLPQSPFAYTPFWKNEEGKVVIKDDLNPGLNRMKTVLSRMYKEEYLTEEEYDQALTFDDQQLRLELEETLKKNDSTPYEKYPRLTYEIETRAKEQLAYVLAKEYGYKEEELKENSKLFSFYKSEADEKLRQEGYKITTTIDKAIYDAQQAAAENYQYYGKEIAGEPVEAGAVLIENKTGKIISFFGGRDFERSQVNYATAAPRPNGSTMKPLLVYAPAFENGFAQPGSVILDAPYNYSGTSHGVHNYTSRYSGFVSARKALTQSYNVPAVKIYTEMLQKSNPMTYLEKMGFSTLNKKRDYNAPAVALGALTDGVSVEENVNAYATFPNYGEFIDAYMIEKIETKEGEVIYQHESQPTRVFSPQTAYLTLNVMRDVVTSGTAGRLNGMLSFSSNWSGKTGTGQDYKDAWFVASNPSVSFGTWMGYEHPETENKAIRGLNYTYKGKKYSERNLGLWAELINAAYKVNPDLIDPNTSFKSPGGIVTRSYCKLTGDLASKGCSEAGLVDSDIYNAKFVPTKKDNSLTDGKFVYVKDKAYQVPSSAPSEFVQTGYTISKDFLKKHNLSSIQQLMQWLPDGIKGKQAIATEADQITDNGTIPSAVTGVRLSGNSLSWNTSGDSDVIGYRVYQAAFNSNSFRKVASVPANQTLSVNISDQTAEYYVVAVDVAGKQSTSYTVVQGSQYAKKGKEQEEKEKQKQEEEEQKAKEEEEAISTEE
ncbi:transglycosylase domain-containing protein [Bacillus carboniphilus]|uniref:Transglycosylase domain-containing protein n=1 Tax=Bacillus carboniphilus TaxID=86663 RepID=A0ABY9JXS9_9BACI|nr:transglycosylase domain-containing protein [Bacillus carboniphilus]WLR44199.1 transglycosylase domain-containing protein [Bacillus carboniphilus]